jgi:hypothetical protein
MVKMRVLLTSAALASLAIAGVTSFRAPRAQAAGETADAGAPDAKAAPSAATGVSPPASGASTADEAHRRNAEETTRNNHRQRTALPPETASPTHRQSSQF